MGLSTKSIYTALHGVIRSHTYFQGWKKEGLGKYWNRKGDIHKGVELVSFFGSWEKSRNVGLAFRLGYPTFVTSCRWGCDCDVEDGRYIVSAFVSPTKGMGEPMVGSDRVWILESQEDLDCFATRLPVLLDTVAVPWLEDLSTEEGLYAWFSKKPSIPIRLPIILTIKGKDQARRELINWLRSCPNYRGRKEFFDWLAENNLISTEMAARLQLAAIQIQATYCAQFQSIAEELSQVL